MTEAETEPDGCHTGSTTLLNPEDSDGMKTGTEGQAEAGSKMGRKTKAYVGSSTQGTYNPPTLLH